MKKILALVLVLALCLTAVAAMADGVAKEDIKLGVILLHDEDSTYDNNFIVGVGIAVEKGFQPGGKALRESGVHLKSLAIVDGIKDGSIVLRPEND